METCGAIAFLRVIGSRSEHPMAACPPIAASIDSGQCLFCPAHISSFHVVPTRIQSESSFRVIGIGTLKFINFVYLIHGNTARKDPCLPKTVQPLGLPPRKPVVPGGRVPIPVRLVFEGPLTSFIAPCAAPGPYPTPPAPSKPFPDFSDRGCRRASIQPPS